MSQQFQQAYPFQRDMEPPQQLNESSGIALSRREILSPCHAVELYQDGALWIIDEEDPPIEIKLDAKAAQKLHAFLMRADEQHNKAAYSYQQSMALTSTRPPKKPIKRDNGDAVFWLLIFWPVGLYMMWKYATWPDIVKGIITLSLVAFALLWWMHFFA